MQQIRLCWNDQVSRLKREEHTSGSWAEATPELLRYYGVIAQAGNEVFGTGTHWTETREVSDDLPPPEAIVRELVERSLQAWLAGDMQAHIDCFYPHAVFVTPTGESHRGRAAMLATFTKERAAMPDLRMVPSGMQISHPWANAAIVLMQGELQHSGIALPERWASSQVVVSTEGDGWRIASLHVSHVR